MILTFSLIASDEEQHELWCESDCSLMKFDCFGICFALSALKTFLLKVKTIEQLKSLESFLLNRIHSSEWNRFSIINLGKVMNVLLIQLLESFRVWRGTWLVPKLAYFDPSTFHSMTQSGSLSGTALSFPKGNSSKPSRCSHDRPTPIDPKRLPCPCSSKLSFFTKPNTCPKSVKRLCKSEYFMSVWTLEFDKLMKELFPSSSPPISQTKQSEPFFFCFPSSDVIMELSDHTSR